MLCIDWISIGRRHRYVWIFKFRRDVSRCKHRKPMDYSLGYFSCDFSDFEKDSTVKKIIRRPVLCLITFNNEIRSLES